MELFFKYEWQATDAYPHNLPRYQRINDEERATLQRLLERKCTCVNEVAPGVDRVQLAACLAAGFREELAVLIPGVYFAINRFP
jgi:hypothetical protein